MVSKSYSLDINRKKYPRIPPYWTLNKLTTKEQIRIKYLNKEAFEEFILSIDTIKSAGKLSFRFIKGCNTKEYPNGNAPKAWKLLCGKYNYKSSTALIKIKKTLEK